MKLTSAFLALALAGCSPSGPVLDDGIAVPAGKTDDFFSLSATEYVLSGRTSVSLEAELAEADEETKLDRVKELIGYKQIGIAWFLTQYLIHKKNDDSNKDFGGFGGMAKAGAFEDLDVEQVDDLTYEFTFNQLVAGGNDLMRSLPTTMGSGGALEFDLEIGKPSNDEMSRLETNNEWYRKAPWSGWNPSAVEDDKKERLTMSIKRETESTDAWFDYQGLFADDKLTIDIHFGWDYHNDFHIRHARAMFNWLRDSRGFDAPVGSFEELSRTSGAFTNTLTAKGRQIEVEVRLYYGKTDSDTDPDTAAERQGARR